MQFQGENKFLEYCFSSANLDSKLYLVEQQSFLWGLIRNLNYGIEDCIISKEILWLLKPWWQDVEKVFFVLFLPLYLIWWTADSAVSLFC